MEGRGNRRSSTRMEMDMKITVRYFAMLREQAQKSSEQLETNSQTPADLFLELKKKYQFTLELKSIRVAINQEYAPLDTKLTRGDELVFIPPVAGG